MTRLALTLVVAMALPLAAAANGVRLHNRDKASYKLYVKHESSAVDTSIGPMTVTAICSGVCTIEIKGSSSSIRARPGDLIVIQQGRLVRGGR